MKLNDKWKIRLCNDTIELNKITIKDTGSLSNFYMIFNKLKGTVVYTIMDMIAGYWQVRVQKENIPKITFVIIWE